MAQGQGQSKGDKPILEYRAGQIKLAIWQHQKQDGGKTWIEHSMVLSKSFKRKGSDDWEEQRVTLFLDDLPAVEALAREAFARLRVDLKVNG